MSEEWNAPDILPHRYPMLQVDRILEIGAESCTALKNISSAEPALQGHFPGAPVFPGVLMVEALAQTVSIWMLQTFGEKDKLPIFAGIESMRFRSMVKPGDQLTLNAKFLSEKKGFYTFETIATVGERVACEGILTVCMR